MTLPHDITSRKRYNPMYLNQLMTSGLHRGCNIHAHVSLNLLDELRKRDEMRDLLINSGSGGQG